MLVGGLAILLLTLSEVGESLDATLASHMIFQHFLFIVTGFLLAGAAQSLLQIARQFYLREWHAAGLWNAKLNSNHLSILTFAVSAILVIFWNLPAQFDAAAFNVAAHIEMHISFLMAGGLIFLGARLSKRLRLLALVVVGKALGLYGMLLLVTPFQVYSVYPAYEQAFAGVALLFIMLALDFTVMPFWLYNYFARAGGGRPTLT
jgi:cytochrome c oxidase assembly factor CtaG